MSYTFAPTSPQALTLFALYWDAGRVTYSRTTLPVLGWVLHSTDPGARPPVPVTPLGLVERWDLLTTWSGDRLVVCDQTGEEWTSHDYGFSLADMAADDIAEGKAPKDLPAGGWKGLKPWERAA